MQKNVCAKTSKQTNKKFGPKMLYLGILGWKFEKFSILELKILKKI